MRDLHFSLDNLPPHLRIQAERQLGVGKVPEKPDLGARIATVSDSTPPDAPKTPRRRGGIRYKANTTSSTQDAPQTLLDPVLAKAKPFVVTNPTKKPVKRRKTLTPDMAGSLVQSCETSPDGDEVRFVLDCSPYMLPTAQEKKIGMIGGKPRLFKVAKVQKAEKTITKAMAPYTYLFKGWKDAPIGVWIDFCYEYPSSTPKKDLVDFRYSLQKPDLDNMNKGFQDSLTAAGIWEDDNKIAELHLRKFRVLSEPKIVIVIRKLHAVAEGADLLAEKKEWFFKDIVGEEFQPGDKTL